MHSKFEHIQRLYLEKLSGVISDTEQSWLDKNLSEDEECKAIWDYLQCESDSLQIDETLASLDVGAQLKKVKQASLENAAPDSLKHRRRLGAAASIVLLIGISCFFLLRRTNLSFHDGNAEKTEGEITLVLANGKTIILNKAPLTSGHRSPEAEQNPTHFLQSVIKENPVGLNTLFVPAKETYQITLPDSTVVTLNAQSHLKFPSTFDKALREVYVEGEAYFDVSNAADQPFIVHTSLGSIKVLGTTFNVNTYQENLVTASLVSGKVQIADVNGENTLLKPGLEAILRKGESIHIQPFEQENKLSWITGILYFYDMPLYELSSILPRWFGTEVIFDTEELAEIRISGLLDKKDLSAFLENMRKSTPINYRLKGNTVYLSK